MARSGRIPPCKGVVAFGATLSECEEQLRSTLEDWVLVGLELGHPLPVLGKIDLNREPIHEPLDTVAVDDGSRKRDRGHP